MKELRDEDVDVHHSELVNLLHLPQNVQQPLKMALTSGDPYEVQLQRGRDQEMISDGVR